MRLISRIVAGFVGATVVASAASAGPVLKVSTPMEFPPVDYTGSQYVDSAGCVFVRAGFEDAPRWVPRVGRDSKHLCGYEPTFGQTQPQQKAATAAPITEPVPVVRSAPAPAASQSGGSGTVIPSTSQKTLDALNGRSNARGGLRAILPFGTRRRSETPASVAAEQAVATAVAEAPVLAPIEDISGTDLSPYETTGYLMDADTLPAADINRFSEVRAPAQTPRAQVPRKVIVATKPPINGYVSAFDDGRLNPHRGPQTLQGDLQMGRVWTREIPARIVTPDTPESKRITPEYLKSRRDR